jgi:hypothetical protein
MLCLAYDDQNIGGKPATVIRHFVLIQTFLRISPTTQLAPTQRTKALNRREIVACGSAQKRNLPS